MDDKVVSHTGYALQMTLGHLNLFATQDNILEMYFSFLFVAIHNTRFCDRVTESQQRFQAII